ncbi:hypothetical protein [Candidatus Chlorohelix sp.]|uniref:hypothetical protein n=1 Tax=Candidatus Chlorohelix sp. TaxID=3139201 RepID=UPI00305B0F5B
MSQENPVQATTKVVRSFNPDKTVKELVEEIRELAGEKHAGFFKALGENAKSKFGKKEGSDLKIPLSLLKLKAVDLATITSVVLYLDSVGSGDKTLNALLSEQGLGKIEGQLNFTRFASQVIIQNRKEKITAVKSPTREVKPVVQQLVEAKLPKPVAQPAATKLSKPASKLFDEEKPKAPTKQSSGNILSKPKSVQLPKSPAKQAAGGILSRAVKRFSSTEANVEKAPVEAKAN